MASAFHAYLSANLNNVTGDNTLYQVLWDSVRFDANNDFNTGSGVFTAPTSGIYRFSASVSLTQLNINNVLGNLLLSTPAGSYVLAYCNPWQEAEKLTGDNRLMLGGSVLVELSASDAVSVYVQVDNSTKTVDIISGNFSNFCGELVQ